MLIRRHFQITSKEYRRTKWITKHQTPVIESQTSTNVHRMGKRTHHEAVAILIVRDPPTER